MKQLLKWINKKIKLLFRFKFAETILILVSMNRLENSLVVRLLLPPSNSYPSQTFRDVVRCGIKYHLDISDLVDWHVYFGIREIAQERLFDLCRPGDLIFDIGVNIGSVSLRFAKKLESLGGGGSIVGFEPDRINYEKCVKNISINKFSNIEIHNIGLGENNENLYLDVPSPSNRGMNRISVIKDRNHLSSLITVVALDSFLLESLLSARVNLIKIDVEGYEMKVLKGALNVLKLSKPIIFIECDDNNLREQGNSASELVSYLKDFGYTMSRADNGEIVDIGYRFDNCHFDIIAKV